MRIEMAALSAFLLVSCERVYGDRITEGAFSPAEEAHIIETITTHRSAFEPFVRRFDVSVPIYTRTISGGYQETERVLEVPARVFACRDIYPPMPSLVLTHELAHAALFDFAVEADNHPDKTALRHSLVSFIGAYRALFESPNAASGIFDETRYVEIPEQLRQELPQVCTHLANLDAIGHPSDMPTELFASGTTILSLFADKFIAEYSALPREEQERAAEVVKSIFALYAENARTVEQLKTLFPRFEELSAMVGYVPPTQQALQTPAEISTGHRKE